MTRDISVNAIPAAVIPIYSSITESTPVNFALERLLLKQIFYSTLPGEPVEPKAEQWSRHRFRPLMSLIRTHQLHCLHLYGNNSPQMLASPLTIHIMSCLFIRTMHWTLALQYLSMPILAGTPLWKLRSWSRLALKTRTHCKGPTRSS